jgi:hypothetical protein
MKNMTAGSDVSEHLHHESAAREAANGRLAAYGLVAPLPRPSPALVHGSIHPADVRPGDPVAARTRPSVARDRRDVPVQVWRLSPLGVELVRPAALGAVQVGTRIDLAIQIGNDRTTFTGLEVAAVHEERGRTLLAARWRDADELRGDRARRRLGARWACQPDYLPTGIAPGAVRYGDFVHFRIAEISKTGMQLLTSMRNKFLVPGATFEATCAFPTLEQVKIAFRVVQARLVEDGRKQALSLGVTWEAQGDRAAEVIGQYLLQFGPGASPEQLRAEGFRVRSTSVAFDFGSVRTEEEYAEVLALRRLAYIHAKKVAPDASPEQMGDEFDARSRIITARYRGRLIGSTRVVFARSETDRLKHDDYVELPAWLPPRTEIIESSKTCTHPDFRGNDLFYSLLKHMALVTFQARRRWLLMSCTDGLRPLYKKLGCKDVGVTYVHPTMGIKHHVMIGDVLSMLVGGMNPIAWNLAIGPDLWRYAKRCGVIPRSAWLEVKIRLIQLLKPVAMLVDARSRRRQERRR